MSFILGIETSCDETSAAVVKDGNEMLSNIISSQIDVHNTFGGVVPEIASRMHTEIILQVVDQALKAAGTRAEELDAIAVTQGPGLIGSLMVGMSTAKALAFSLEKPLVGVNHLEAHIAIAHLQNKIDFPFVALIVSGGHTNLYSVNGFLDFELLGSTRDDAAGEAFDKGAKALGLGYPGGVEIDRLSRNGNPEAIRFPRPLNDESPDFSFSGLKTSLLNYLRKNPIENEKELFDICAGFQEAIVETLVNKTLTAARKKGVKSVVLAGGVACNSRLRKLAEDRIGSEGINVFIPPPVFCTDNAAMIATLGYHMYADNRISSFEISPYSTSRQKPSTQKNAFRKTSRNSRQ